MKIIFLLMFLLVSCATPSIKVGSEGLPHASMQDKSHVTSGIPDLYIEKVIDSRSDISKLGEVKAGALGDLVPVVFNESFDTDMTSILNAYFLKKGFQVSVESKNQLIVNVNSLKIWESPPRYIPERSYCEIKANIKLFSVKENRDLWMGDVLLEIESPEGFDVTGMTNATFHTCVDYFVSKIASDRKLQKVLNYNFQ